MSSISIEALLSQMTLAEKIGQMTQSEKNSVTPDDVAHYGIGSVLSGGGGNPDNNSAATWAAMTEAYIDGALRSRLAIPLIYGADCVHGHNNAVGATIFPHNIGLGAARDADLVEQIGYITACEMLATNVHWNFAPCLAVPQDARWGRTFEGYAGNTELVTELGAAYVRGLQRGGAAACIKHYVGDGGAEWGTHRMVSWATFWEDNGGQWAIDQGDVNLDEATFRRVHLAPYQTAVEAGALTVMASFNSWRGLKMHAHRYLLTDVLKNEMGFKGFIVTDWMGLNQLSKDYYTCVVWGINAGIDMVMVPYDFKGFIDAVTSAVANGDIRLSRIDDAVRRILYVKQQLGLFERPKGDPALRAIFGNADHRAVARKAAQKSVVLLKNTGNVLPLPDTDDTILLAGPAGDDIGLQCGGWTVEWQGKTGNDTVPGLTLAAGLQAHEYAVEYNRDAEFPSGTPRAKIGIITIAEATYAEGCGDQADLTLSAVDVERVQRMRGQVDKLVLVLFSGRPLVIEAVEGLCDAIVAAWLPGSEGIGVADVLCGKAPFTGRLPHDWVAANDHLPQGTLTERGIRPRFAYGFGL